MVEQIHRLQPRELKSDRRMLEEADGDSDDMTRTSLLGIAAQPSISTP